MDDQRVGASLRALRLRRRLRQVDACARAGIPRTVAMRIEGGRLDRVAFGDIRHARLHEAMATWLGVVGGWLVVPEVSFAYEGERGVIDIVAWHAASRTMLLIELKTRIVDINDLMATMDIRRRLATRIALDHGWEPISIGFWVVVAPGRTNARILAEHATTLRAKFPADGRVMRGWLTRPTGPISGLSFLPQVRLGDLGRDATTPRRVRRPSSSVGAASNRPVSQRSPRIGVTLRD